MSTWKSPMLRTILALFLAVTLLIPTSGVAAAQPSRPGRGRPMTQPASELITYVNSSGIGRIAVRLRLPQQPRYPEGAPIVVSSKSFLVPYVGFESGHDLNMTLVGCH